LAAPIRVVVHLMAVRGCRRYVGAGKTLFHDQRHIFVDRAGMRLFLLHAQFGQHVENDAGLDL
jgi:hypothetical protein